MTKLSVRFGADGHGARTLQEAALVDTDAASYLARRRREAIHVVSEAKATPSETLAILNERQAHAAAGGTFKTPPEGDYPTLAAWHAAAKPLSLDPAQRALDGLLDSVREQWGENFVDFALAKIAEKSEKTQVPVSLDPVDLGAMLSKLKAEYDTDHAHVPLMGQDEEFVGPVLVRAAG